MTICFLFSSLSCFLLCLDIFPIGVKGFDIFMKNLSVNVVLRNQYYRSTAGDDTDEVRDCHQAIKCIREIPRQLKVHCGSYHNEADKDDPEDDDLIRPEQIFKCPGSVFTPAQCCAVGKQEYRNCDKH